MEKRYIVNRHDSGSFGLYDTKNMRTVLAVFSAYDCDIVYRIADLLNEHGAVPKKAQ